MPPSLSGTARIVGSLLLALTPLLAQSDPVSFAIKLRTGTQMGAAKDHLASRLIGFGIEYGLEVGRNRFALELGWSYKPGDQYRLDQNRIPVASGRVLLPGLGMDLRRNELKGLAARLAWQHNAGWMGFQAGLQLGGSQYRQEYLGDVQGADAAAPTKAVFRDSYNGVLTRGGMAVSPFAGVSFRLDGTSSVEINVLALRYKSLDYVHQAGLVTSLLNGDVSRDTITETSRALPHLEVAYVMRF